MYKFVNANQSGNTPKRQQTQKACSPCRKRKKRCHHHEPDHDEHQHSPTTARGESMTIEQILTPSTNPAEGNDQSSPVSNAVHQSSSSRVPVNEHSSTSQPTKPATPNTTQLLSNIAHVRNESLGARFIGDLNPESIFLAASSPDATRGSSMEDSVGVWLRSTINKRLLQTGSHHLPAPTPTSLFFGSSSLIQDALVPLLQQECLSMLPPPEHLEALSKLYFERLHPIFPVIDLEEFQVAQATNCSVLLKQAICLAASKNFAAKAHLYLPESTDLLSPMDFGDKIARSMRISIEMGLVTDKVVLIQGLALMSQFFDSSDRGDLSSQ